MGVKKKRIRVFCDIVTFSAGDKNFYFFAATQKILSLQFFCNEAICKINKGLFTASKIPLACWWVLNIAHETSQINYVQTRMQQQHSNVGSCWPTILRRWQGA